MATGAITSSVHFKELNCYCHALVRRDNVSLFTCLSYFLVRFCFCIRCIMSSWQTSLLAEGASLEFTYSVAKMQENTHGITGNCLHLA